MVTINIFCKDFNSAVGITNTMFKRFRKNGLIIRPISTKHTHDSDISEFICNGKKLKICWHKPHESNIRGRKGNFCFLEYSSANLESMLLQEHNKGVMLF